MNYSGVEKRKFVRFNYPFLIQYKPIEKGSEEESLSSISSSVEEILKRWEEKGYDKNMLYSSLLKEMKDFSFSKNISEGGICLITKEKFKTNIYLKIDIYIPTRKEPITGIARVAWIKKRVLRTGYETGICFVKMSENNKRTLSNILGLFSKTELEEVT